MMDCLQASLGRALRSGRKPFCRGRMRRPRAIKQSLPSGASFLYGYGRRASWRPAAAAAGFGWDLVAAEV